MPAKKGTSPMPKMPKGMHKMPGQKMPMKDSEMSKMMGVKPPTKTKAKVKRKATKKR